MKKKQISAETEHTVPSTLFELPGYFVLPHQVPPILAAASPIPSDTTPEHKSK